MRPQVPPAIQSGILNDGKRALLSYKEHISISGDRRRGLAGAQPGISQSILMSVSALLQTARGRYFLDGQNYFLADIPVPLTNVDVYRSIRFTRNCAVQFRL
jgi:hypothetical protein